MELNFQEKLREANILIEKVRKTLKDLGHELATSNRKQLKYLEMSEGLPEECGKLQSVSKYPAEIQAKTTSEKATITSDINTQEIKQSTITIDKSVDATEKLEIVSDISNQTKSTCILVDKSINTSRNVLVIDDKNALTTVAEHTTPTSDFRKKGHLHDENTSHKQDGMNPSESSLEEFDWLADLSISESQNIEISSQTKRLRKDPSKLSIQKMPPVIIRRPLMIQTTLNLHIKPSGNVSNEIENDFCNIGFEEVVHKQKSEDCIEPIAAKAGSSSSLGSKKSLILPKESENSLGRDPWDIGFCLNRSTQCSETGFSTIVNSISSNNEAVVEIPERELSLRSATSPTTTNSKPQSLRNLTRPKETIKEKVFQEEATNRSGEVLAKTTSKDTLDDLEEPVKDGKIPDTDLLSKEILNILQEGRIKPEDFIDQTRRSSVRVVEAEVPFKKFEPPTELPVMSPRKSILNNREEITEVLMQVKNKKSISDSSSSADDVSTEEHSKTSKSLSGDDSSRNIPGDDRMVPNTSIAPDKPSAMTSILSTRPQFEVAKADISIQVSLSSLSDDNFSEDISSSKDTVSNFIQSLTGSSQDHLQKMKSTASFSKPDIQTWSKSKTMKEEKLRRQSIINESKKPKSSIYETTLEQIMNENDLQNLKKSKATSGESEINFLQQFQMKPSTSKDNPIIMSMNELGEDKLKRRLPFYKRIMGRILEKNLEKSMHISYSAGNPIDDSLSEGEVPCKCNVSVGEIHPCKYKPIPSQRQLTKWSTNATRREVNDKTLAIARERAQFRKWITQNLHQRDFVVNDDSSSLSLDVDDRK